MQAQLRVLPLYVVGFESFFNSVWLILGFIALVFMLAQSAKGRASVLSAALIVTTLFPVISASDDVIRIEHLQRSHDTSPHKDNAHKRTSDNLIRLFETMESAVAVAAVELFFTLLFAFFVQFFCDPYTRRFAISPIGRSPPVCFA